MWGPLPPPRPSQLRLAFLQYFGVKIMYRCDRKPQFFRFFFFLFLDLFFLLFSFFKFLFISSYSSLLISSYSSFRYYSSSSYSSLLIFWTVCCIIDMIHPSFWWVFRGGQAFLSHLGSKLMYPVRPYVLTFLLYSFFVFWSFLLVTLFFFFSSYFSSYSTLLIFKLFIVLQTCILNTHWVKEHK